MSRKVVSWGPEEWSVNLLRRFESAKEYRKQFESQWVQNLQTINTAASRGVDEATLTFDNAMEIESGDVDAGDSEIGMNYAFKYLRFFHSQLSANPPSVIARPTSSDPKDRRKADAGDRLVRWGMHAKGMQEIVDQMTLNMLQLGTGYIKETWDKDGGEAVDFNEETSEVELEGDISIYSPDSFKVWLDPDAKRKADVRYIFEELEYTLEEAIFKFPDSADTLRRHTTETNDRSNWFWKKTAVGEDKVRIIEYYEKGMPVNGLVGRHAYMLEDGTLIGSPGKNPHIHARIPYHILTYIDIPNQVYGKSTVDYVARLQEMLNRLDSSTLDAIQAHNVVRLILSGDQDIEDEDISNSNWDWVKVGGQGDIKYLQPPALMADSWRFRDQLVTAIQELYGINDSMLGIQRREQSAVSQQTAIEAGTMIHRRLFKKYEDVVEGIYKDFLGLIREKWTIPRTILVLGKEKAFEAADIKGADIAGGFDIVVEYGASLPLDPNMRRESIMLMMPVLKEAGMTSKQILAKMKLNDLEGIHDRAEMSADRQREIFEEMVANHEKGLAEYIAPKEMEDHAARLEYAYDYLESSEFKYLEDDLKAMIRQHVKEREGLAAAQAAPEPAAGGQPGLPAGMPGVDGALDPTAVMPPL